MVILVIEKAWKSKLRHFTLEAWITVNVWSQVHGESWWQRPYQNLLSYEHVSRNSVSVCHIMVRDCSDGVCLTLHHLCLHSQIQMSIYWSRIPVPKAEGIEESPNSCIIYSKLECKLETKVARYADWTNWSWLIYIVPIIAYMGLNTKFLHSVDQVQVQLARHLQRLCHHQPSGRPWMKGASANTCKHHPRPSLGNLHQS